MSDSSSYEDNYTNNFSSSITVHAVAQKDFLSYLEEWEEEAKHIPGKKGEKNKYCLSRETLQGMRITG